MRTDSLLALLVLSLPLAAAERVSVSTGSSPANGPSTVRGISQDARYVLFESSASNLVGLIFPPARGLYLRDRFWMTTTLVFYPGEGRPHDATDGAISGDGRFIAWVASTGAIGAANEYQVWVLDRVTGGQAIASTGSFGARADRDAGQPALSGDGRWLAFVSRAGNLDAASPTGDETADVYLKDRVTGATTVASVTPLGAAGTGESSRPAISRNGRRIAFHSTSTELVPGTPARLGGGVFVYDVVAATVVRADAAADGSAPSSPPRDLEAPAISGDGRLVAFCSGAADLVPGDTNGVGDVLVKDLQTGAVELISIASDGSQANALCFDPSLSSDGRWVTFRSEATNLVGGDTNGKLDVFVRDRLLRTTARVSFGTGGVQSDGDSPLPQFVSGDGSAVVFNSDATNLAGTDLNGVRDVFLSTTTPSPGFGSGAAAEFRIWVRAVIVWIRHAISERWLGRPHANG